MTQHLATATEIAESPPVCPHHWVIQAATGPVSSGICRNCGAVKEFRNYVDASYWNDDTAGAALRLVADIRSKRPLEEEEE